MKKSIKSKLGGGEKGKKGKARQSEGTKTNKTEGGTKTEVINAKKTLWSGMQRGKQGQNSCKRKREKELKPWEGKKLTTRLAQKSKKGNIPVDWGRENEKQKNRISG